MKGAINNDLWQGVCTVANMSLKMEVEANRQGG